MNLTELMETFNHESINRTKRVSSKVVKSTCLKTCKKREQTKSREEALGFLRLRALVFHFLYSVVRLVNWFTGAASWSTVKCRQAAEHEGEILAEDQKVDSQGNVLDDCPNYNVELLEKFKPYTRIALGTLLVLCLVLDVIAYKYRWVCQSFLYIEGLLFILFPLVPNSFHIEMRKYIVLLL